MILRLDCPVQHYAWGSTDSIPRLMQRDNPESQPWAELWMGAHPKAPSRTLEGQSLEELIAADPVAALGRAQVLHGGKLPYLMKVLAAASPLSIQCHPNREQAQAGCAREDAAGIPRNAGHRNYRDDNHKPELIYALETFWAMKGFREPTEAAALIRSASGDALGELVHALEQGDEPLREFFAGLLALDASATTRALDALAAGCSALPEAERRWVEDLLRRYPGDIGAFAPLFLNVVQLQPGQALYLGAGELHAYLEGTGMEIMASSDNVLRGGLTPKHMDPKELVAVLRFEPGSAEPMEGEALDGDARVTHFPVPCDDFRFRVVELASDEEYRCEVDSAELLFFVGDSLQLESEGQAPLGLISGQTAYCPASQGRYLARGRGRLFIASC